MSDWMRRRIERSRARCDRSATAHKPDKVSETDPEANKAASRPESNIIFMQAGAAKKD